MQLVQPLPYDPAGLANARHHLDAAEAAAGVVGFGKVEPGQTATKLWEGLNMAKLAAADLFSAQPESDFQDLVRARQQVLQGADLLAQAISAYGTAQGVDPTVKVRELASKAWTIFDDTYEILANN